MSNLPPEQMTARVSTGSSTGVDNFTGLLQELARMQTQNRKLRRRLYLVTCSRDYWKARALRQGL